MDKSLSVQRARQLFIELIIRCQINLGYISDQISFHKSHKDSSSHIKRPELPRHNRVTKKEQKMTS